MPAAYMNRQDMCRMRQGIRQNVTMTDLQHSNIPPQHPTTHPSPPKSNAIKSSTMPSPPNLFKEALHQQMPRQPRPRRGKPPPYNQPTADNVSLGEQMQHLKQYYEERVVVLVQRCTEAETKLGVLTSERRDVDTQLQHLQALAHSQHDQLQTARQEYASLLDWCREREAHYQRTEHDLAATDTLNQTLVHQVEGLNAARQAFEVEWTKQRNAWAQRQEEGCYVARQAVLRNDILTKDTTIQDLHVARDHMESQRLHLKSVNAGLVDQVTKLSHRAVVLEGQVQMEIEFKRSTVAEAEALTQQLHAERRDRQALAMQTQLENQQHRRDFRDRDMACRELTHRCQRMTNDLVVATTRYEKAEAALEHLTGATEARKEDLRQLQADVQRLQAQLADARAAVESKDVALVAAKRELSGLQARVVAEEAKKLEALDDVNALNQRIATLRRDNMHLISRLESPIPLSVRA